MGRVASTATTPVQVQAPSTKTPVAGPAPAVPTPYQTSGSVPTGQRQGSQGVQGSGGTLVQTGEQGGTGNTNGATRGIKLGWLWEFTALIGLRLYMAN
jgi:hypothetical protein